MPRKRKYFVSGVIQIEVEAPNAEAAVTRAQEYASRMGQTRRCVMVSLDNISTPTLPSVALPAAAVLDQTPTPEGP